MTDKLDWIPPQKPIPHQMWFVERRTGHTFHAALFEVSVLMSDEDIVSACGEGRKTKPADVAEGGS